MRAYKQVVERVEEQILAGTLRVGDRLPAIPLFLTEYDYVPCPLDPTYDQAWAVFPDLLKEVVEPPPAGGPT